MVQLSGVHRNDEVGTVCFEPLGAEDLLTRTRKKTPLLVGVDVNRILDHVAVPETRQKGHALRAGAPDHHLLLGRLRFLQAGLPTADDGLGRADERLDTSPHFAQIALRRKRVVRLPSSDAPLQQQVLVVVPGSQREQLEALRTK
jgi:hypothetical protein